MDDKLRQQQKGVTQTGVGQGNASAPPFFAYICCDMYSLQEALDATTGKQHNKTTNDPSQGDKNLTKEGSNEVTCKKEPYEYKSCDNLMNLPLLDNANNVLNSPEMTQKGGKDMLYKDLAYTISPYTPALANSDHLTDNDIITPTTMDSNTDDGQYVLF